MVHTIDCFWCHICATTVAVNLDEATQEYACNVCSSTFVEAPEQNLETFLHPDEDPEETEPQQSSDSVGEDDESVPDLEPGRPVGTNVPVSIVVYQTSSERNPNINNVDSLASLLTGLGSLTERTRPDPTTGALNRTFEDLLHHILMNDSHAQLTPASAAVLAALPRESFVPELDGSTKGSTDCSITQEAFEPGDVILTLPCEHRFKEAAILEWLQRSNICPVCRHVVPESEVEGTEED